jgi:transposase
LAADKGYDSRAFRQALAKRNIRGSIPERQFAHRRKLGRPPLQDKVLSGLRWVVERTHAWMDSYRKLCRRYERTISSFAAVNIVGCLMVCLGKVVQ